MGDRVRLVVFLGNGIEVRSLAHWIRPDEQVPGSPFFRCFWEEHHLVVGQLGLLLLDRARHGKDDIECGGNKAYIFVWQNTVVQLGHLLKMFH